MDLKNIKKNGFSLLELMLVLGVIAALIIAAFMIYPKVSNSLKVSTEERNILTIKTVVVQTYAGKAYYDNALNNSAFFKTILPTNISQWGSIYQLSGQLSQEAGIYQGFSIVIDSIPKDSCIKLASDLQNNFTRIAVNGTYVVVSPNKLFQTVNFDINNAVSACTDNSEIQFDYFG